MASHDLIVTNPLVVTPPPTAGQVDVTTVQPSEVVSGTVTPPVVIAPHVITPIKDEDGTLLVVSICTISQLV